MGVLEDWGKKLGFGPGDHSAEDRVQDRLGKMEQASNGLKAPNIGPVDLQHHTYVGDVTPDKVGWQPSQTVQEGATNLGGISTDPRMKEAQLRALSSMQGVADSGGMTAADTANMSRLQGESDSDDAARRGAILQGMHQRGMGGSGAELLAQLQSSQASTDRQAQGGRDIAGLAQQRALQAMQGAGSMAGGLRSQDYGEQAQRAQAQDSIDRFNAGAGTQNNQFNASGGFQGQAFNANLGFQGQVHNRGAQQAVANSGTDTTNQQELLNKVQIPQGNFNNQNQVVGTQQRGMMPGIQHDSSMQAVNTQTQGNKLGAIIGGAATLGGAALGGPAGAAAGSSLVSKPGNKVAGPDVRDSQGAGEQYAAWGGRVPGMPSAPGNSPINDKVPAMLSPGEVVVPRTVAQHPSQAGSFVQHASQISPVGTPQDKQKEAMLSALRNLHKRGA